MFKTNKKQALLRRKQRVRKKVVGRPDLPRMAYRRSNKNIYVHFIDDINNKTILTLSTLSFKSESICNNCNIKSATDLGEAAAKKALEKGIKAVVFDRGGYLYHGKVKALAAAARKAGMKF